VRQGELESGLEELLDVGATNVVLLFNLGNADNLDRPKSGTVAGGEVLVHLLNGLGTRESAELFDHLYGALVGVEGGNVASLKSNFNQGVPS
jgi:hypothetical protein